MTDYGTDRAMPGADVQPRVGASHALRVALTLAVTLVVALVLDVWMRFFLLPWYWLRNDETGRIRAINGLVRSWGRFTVRQKKFVLGIRIEVVGAVPRSGRYIVVSNHQSSLDIPVLIDTFQTLDLKFVAKEELRQWKPGVSLALRNGGFAFLAKKSLGEDLAILTRFASGVASFGGSPTIFPEGIRTFDGEVQEFHMAGTETVRRVCRLPVLPVTIDGLWAARSIWQYGRLVGSRVTIHIDEPIPTEAFDDDPREAAKQLEARIRGNLRAIRRRSEV